MKYIDSDKLRAEIERRKGYISVTHFAEDLLALLDTLEEPVSEDLEKEIDAYYKEWDGNCRYAQTARHFAKWGAEHLADVSKMISEDLEDCLELNEAAEKFARLYDNGTCDGIAQDCFKAGAEWQKDKDTEAVIVAEDRGFLKGADWARAKMMEGAVEGEIQMRYSGALCAKTIHAINEDEFKLGDKVRIIILPKEGEK